MWQFAAGEKRTRAWTFAAPGDKNGEELSQQSILAATGRIP
jgi:hypothetical protein